MRAGWSVLIAFAVVLECYATETGPNATTVGPDNVQLADGAAALQAGDYEEGVRLTLGGLRQPSNSRDFAAGYSNLCAGYAALRRWDKALTACNTALGLDRNNWRSWNNRAAVFVGMREYDLALLDVQAGLEIAPESPTLKQSLRIVQDHQRAHKARRRAAVEA